MPVANENRGYYIRCAKQHIGLMGRTPELFEKYLAQILKWAAENGFTLAEVISSADLEKLRVRGCKVRAMDAASWIRKYWALDEIGRARYLKGPDATIRALKEELENGRLGPDSINITAA